MNCGCGSPNERHKEGDITKDDMQRAAQNHGMDIEQAADNIHQAAREMRQAGQAR